MVIDDKSVSEKLAARFKRCPRVNHVVCSTSFRTLVPVASYHGRYGLTRKEADVCDLTVLGLTANEIAVEMHTTIQVIKNILVVCYDKIGCDDCLNLGILAWELAK